MKRSRLKRTVSLSRTQKPLERKSTLGQGNGPSGRETASLRGTARQKAISAATPAQRKKVKGEGCIVHGLACRGPVDPAHVIPRSLLGQGQDDPLAVVGICRPLHERYDRRAQPFLNLLPFLGGRPELDFAIERFGHDRALWRITNTRPA